MRLHNGLVTALMAVLSWLVAVPLSAQSQLEPSSTEDKESAARRNARAVRFVFDERPSLRVGNTLRLDVRIRTQADWRDFPSEFGAAPKVFELHRARVGIEGTFLKYLEYEVEREVRDTTDPWRDVYLNARPLRALQVQGGRFKIPFSRDQLTGGSDLDFTYRSLAGTYLAPGRDVGVMAHGALFGDVLRYQVGVFRKGGENVRASEHADPQSQRTSAARIVIRPWDRPRTFRPLRALALAARGESLARAV